MRRTPRKHLERQKRSKTMRMQQPKQWQSSQVTPGSRVSAFGILTIVFSSIGFGPAIVGIVGSALVLSNRGGSSNLLTGGILGLVGSILALLLFVTIFVLSVTSAARSAVRSQRTRFR